MGGVYDAGGTRTTLAEGLRLTLDYYRQIYAANPRCLEQMTARNWEK